MPRLWMVAYVFHEIRDDNGGVRLARVHSSSNQYNWLGDVLFVVSNHNHWNIDAFIGKLLPVNVCPNDPIYANALISLISFSKSL